jgi:ribose transport system permease protein
MENRMHLPTVLRQQETIVAVLTVLLFVAFALAIPDFIAPANLLNIARSVAPLGILALGMAVVVIGRGIDLSMVGVLAISAGWVLQLTQDGVGLPVALLGGFAVALAAGLINGIVVAFLEVPPLLATLAMSSIIYGIGRSWLIHMQVVYLPDNAADLAALGQGVRPVLLFLLAALLVWLYLRFVRWGRFDYAIGDNPAAARLTGIPVRAVQVINYVASALIGCLAGLVTASTVSSINVQMVSSTMVYDVILVVVLGGIGLSGGRGGVRNILMSTLLIGILLNSMTLLNTPYHVQNLVKALILLAAIALDSALNPRNEQTAQQGDL